MVVSSINTQIRQGTEQTKPLPSHFLEIIECLETHGERFHDVTPFLGTAAQKAQFLEPLLDFGD